MKPRNARPDPTSPFIHRRYGIVRDAPTLRRDLAALYDARKTCPRPPAGEWTRRFRLPSGAYYRWMYDDAGRYHGEFLTRWGHVRLTLAEWWSNGIRRPR